MPEPRAERVAWTPLPFFHIAALQVLIFCIGEGITVLSDVNLDAGRALQMIQDHRATSLWPGFVVAMRTLMDAPGFSAERLSFVTSIITGGPPADLYRLQELFLKPRSSMAPECRK